MSKPKNHMEEKIAAAVRELKAALDKIPEADMVKFLRALDNSRLANPNEPAFPFKKE